MSIMSNQEQLSKTSLGTALKEARVAASLTLEEASEHLNLNVTTLRDLEDELDETITSQKYPCIYLRGYLVNYSKLVGLTSLDEYAEYQQLTEHHKSTALLHKAKKKENKHSNKSFLYLLIAVLLIISVYFAQQSLSTIEPEEVINTEIATLKIGKAAVNKVIQQDLMVEDESYSDDVIKVENNESELPIISSTEEVKTINPRVESVNSSVVIDTASNESNSVDTAVEIEAEKEAQQTTEEATVVATSEKIVDTENINVETLILSFAKDCWTEIFDATGKRLAFNLYKEGSQLSVTGTPPFKLKLGDPSVVEIQYQGKVVDGQYKSGRTARFSIPQ